MRFGNGHATCHEDLKGLGGNLGLVRYVEDALQHPLGEPVDLPGLQEALVHHGVGAQKPLPTVGGMPRPPSLTNGMLSMMHKSSVLA